MSERLASEDWAEHVASLRRYAFALTASRQEAEDLVQDTLARAIAAAGSWRRTGSLRAWLFSIMHNAFLTGVRAQRPRVHQPEEGDLEPAQPPPQLARLEVQEVLRALTRLPEPQRAAITLIALEEFSYEEAAAILGVPLGTLMSRLARGRETLRRIVNGEPRPHLRVVENDR